MSAGDPVLEIRRVFAAEPSRVLDAWLKREQWQAWLGPEGVRCEVPLLEPRAGGHYRVVMHFGGGRTLPIVGVFQEVEARRAVFTWGPADSPKLESLVTVSLRDVDGNTELTLRHEKLGTAANRDNHERGWNSALNKLTRFLQTST